MNTIDTILHIYPNLEHWVDFIVENHSDGNWDIITWYNKEYTLPTQADLETAWIDFEKAQDLVKVKKGKSEAIDKVASLSDQLNLMASVLDTLTSATPDQAIINNAKAKFAEIKTILNK